MKRLLLASVCLPGMALAQSTPAGFVSGSKLTAAQVGAAMAAKADANGGTLTSPSIIDSSGDVLINNAGLINAMKGLRVPYSSSAVTSNPTIGGTVSLIWDNANSLVCVLTPGATTYTCPVGGGGGGGGSVTQSSVVSALSGSSLFDSNGNVVTNIGEPLAPVSQEYVYQAGLDINWTQRTNQANQPCIPVSYLTQNNGSGGFCLNYVGTFGAYNKSFYTFTGGAAGATTIAVEAASGQLYPGMTIRVGSATGNLLGTIATVGATTTQTDVNNNSENVTSLTLVSPGLTQAVTGTNGGPSGQNPLLYFGWSDIPMTVATTAATGSTAVTVSSLPGGVNSNLIVYDVDAQPNTDQETPGQTFYAQSHIGAVVGTISSVSGSTITFTSATTTPVKAGDRLFATIPNASGGATAMAVGIQGHSYNGQVVTYGGRADAPGYSQNMGVYGFDNTTQCEVGSVTCTMISIENDMNPHAQPSANSAGVVVQNDGEYDIPYAFLYRDGESTGGFNYAYAAVSSTSSSRLHNGADFYSNSGNSDSFKSNGSNAVGFEANGTYSNAAFDYTPYINGAYDTVFQVKGTTGNIYTAGSLTSSSNTMGSGYNYTTEYKAIQGSVPAGATYRLSPVGGYPDGPTVNNAETQTTASAAAVVGATNLTVVTTAGAQVGAPVYDATTSTLVGTINTVLTSTTLTLTGSGLTGAVSSGDAIRYVAPTQELDASGNMNNGSVIATYSCDDSGNGGGNRETIRVTREYAGYATQDEFATILASSPLSVSGTATTTASAAASATNVVSVASTLGIIPGAFMTDTTTAANVPNGTIVTGVISATQVVVSGNVSVASGDGLKFVGQAPATGLSGVVFNLERDPKDGAVGVALTNGFTNTLYCVVDVTIMHHS